VLQRNKIKDRKCNFAFKNLLYFRSLDNHNLLYNVGMENNLQGIGVGINVESYPVNQFLTDLPICALIVKAQMTCLWRQT
jgi:hypothetical protein